MTMRFMALIINNVTTTQIYVLRDVNPCGL